jgi:hypothetical protein
LPPPLLALPLQEKELPPLLVSCAAPGAGATKPA